MGIKLAILTVILGVFLLAASSILVLHVNDSGLHIEQSTKDKNILHLSGSIQNSSSLSIYHVFTFEWKSSIRVFVICGIVIGKMTGQLNHYLQIPESINTVTFGMDDIVIWHREKGIFTGPASPSS